jgi:hypothetical protein
MEDRRYAYTVLVRRPEGKKPLGSLWRKCEDNIKIELREVRWGNTDWIDVAQDWNRKCSFVNKAMNLFGSIKCQEFLDWLRTC